MLTCDPGVSRLRDCIAPGLKLVNMAKYRSRWPQSWLYPELKLFPTEEALRHAARRATSILLRIPTLWLGLAVVVILPILIPELIFRIHRPGGIAEGVLRGAISFLGGGVGGVWIVLSCRRRVRAFLRQCLCENGVPMCIPCGYDLRGNTTGICPECGAPIRKDNEDCSAPPAPSPPTGGTKETGDTERAAGTSHPGDQP